MRSICQVILILTVPVVACSAEPAIVRRLTLPEDLSSKGECGWVGYSPTGRFLAVYSTSEDGSCFCVWDTSNWKTIATSRLTPSKLKPRTEYGAPMAYLAEGSHLVFGDTKSISGQPLGAASSSLSFSASRQAETAYSSIWAASKGTGIMRISVNDDANEVLMEKASFDKSDERTSTVMKLEMRGGTSAIALAPNCSIFAWAERVAPLEFDRVVKINVSFLDGKKAPIQLATTEPANRISCLAFSPDGTTLAAGSEDGAVRLWDLAIGKEFALFKGPLFRVSSLAFSLDGRFLAYGTYDVERDGNVWIVSVKERRHIASWSADPHGVRSVSFCANGDQLAVVGGHRKICVFDTRKVLSKDQK